MSNANHNDNRRFHRVLYQAGALLSNRDKTWLCEICDLSLKGCLLSFTAPWQESDAEDYTLTIHLTEESQITMQLCVSHYHDNLVGFKCKHIDLDSISDLRRLVELNLGDSALLERDLQALWD